MEDSEILGVLLSLASEAGLEVRMAGRRSAEEPPPQSGVCRVRDRVWVILSGADPARAQCAVLGRALRDHAGAVLEERFLPPAVRAWVGGGPDV